MKKLYLLIFTIVSFIGLSSVNALSINDNVLPFDLNQTYPYSCYDNINSTISNDINSLISYWESNYSTAFPYYVVYPEFTWNCQYIRSILDFSYSNEVRYFSSYKDNTQYYSVTYQLYGSWDRPNDNVAYKPYHRIYTDNGDVVIFNPDVDSSWSSNKVLTWEPTYDPSLQVIPYYHNGLVFSNLFFDSSIEAPFDLLTFDSINSNGINYSSFSVYPGEVIPSYKSLKDNSYTPDYSQDFTTINLNDYDYVVLNLKNYNSSTPFSTNIYTLGQLCSTRVNDYGRSEAFNPQFNDYSQGCTDIYNISTPVRFYVNSDIFTNHSVWYIKAYNSNISNVIKVDPDIFDITYIPYNTSDPTISIGNTTYNIIPFNNLSSTANMSTSNGYISGQVTSIFDTMSNDNVFQNILEHPLHSLTIVWSSVLSIFGVIGIFISLLPPILQSFLILAFAIGIILGILKIIL